MKINAALRLPLEDVGSSRQNTEIGGKRFYDHTMDHISTTSGLKDVVDVINYGIQWFKKFVGFSRPASENTYNSLRNTLDITGTVLDLPNIFTSAGKTIKSVAALRTAQNVSDASERKDATQKAMKDVLLNSTYCVNAIADTAGNLHGLKAIDLAQAAPAVNGLYNVTRIATDGYELVAEVKNIHDNTEKSALAVSDSTKALFSKSNTLSMIKIAKCVASIAGSVIAVLALIFTGIVGSSAILPTLLLGASSLWLVLKIGSTFYEKIVIESHNKSMDPLASSV